MILEVRETTTFLDVINSSLIYRVCIGLTHYRKKTFWATTMDHRWDFTYSLEKKLFLQAHIERSADIYESSELKLCRTSTGIQSGSKVLVKSSTIMAFLIILEVTGVFWSFRLVLEGKVDKEPLESSRKEFSEHVSVTNFAWSNSEGNTLGSLNRGGIVDLVMLTSLGASKNFFQQLLALLAFLKLALVGPGR